MRNIAEQQRFFLGRAVELSGDQISALETHIADLDRARNEAWEKGFAQNPNLVSDLSLWAWGRLLTTIDLYRLFLGKIKGGKTIEINPKPTERTWLESRTEMHVRRRQGIYGERRLPSPYGMTDFSVVISSESERAELEDLEGFIVRDLVSGLFPNANDRESIENSFFMRVPISISYKPSPTQKSS